MLCSSGRFCRANDMYFSTTLPGVGKFVENIARRYMGVKDLSVSAGSVDMGPFMDSRGKNICIKYFYLGLR